MALAYPFLSTAALLQCVRVLSNWRAFLLLIASALLAFVLCVLLSSVNMFWLGLLVACGVTFYGVNAVGILLMDGCRAGVPTPVTEAIRRALCCGHRVLLAGLLGLLGLLLLALAASLLLLVCKLPWLGPLLLVLVLPLSALVVGTAFVLLIFFYMPMVACAVWTGAGVAQAVSYLLAIARRRLLMVLLQRLVLLFVIAMVGSLLSMVLFSGLLLSNVLTSMILQTSFLSVGSLELVFLMVAQGDGQMLAQMLGVALLLILPVAVSVLMTLKGDCQIYLEASDTLASELPGTSGDPLRNTAARLRAADEQVQAQQAAAHGINSASSGQQRVEPSGELSADGAGLPASPGAADPSSAPATAPAPVPATTAATTAASGVVTASAASEASAAPAAPLQEQQSLGFAADEPGLAPNPEAASSGPDGATPPKAS